MEIKTFTFEEKGMTRVYENDQWMVGIKNWKPENDSANFDNMERHNLTDELFVLLAGNCTLLYAEEVEGEMRFGSVKMEQNKVYCIPKTMWHNTITTPDVKLVLIENSNTSMDNSEIYEFNEAELVAAKAAIS